MKKWILLALAVAVVAIHTAMPQGSLTPPGAPAPTMKTLDQIEPRIPISSAPFTIAASGSYYLTTNVTGTAGITVTASDVTLDLAGFTLAGSAGSGDAVTVVGTLSNVCVRNGIVRGWGANGVNLGAVTSARVEGMNATKNGGAGLRVGAGALIRDCVSSENAGSGIVAGDNCQITHCVTRLNQEWGISALTSGNTLKDCTADANHLGGIVVSGVNTLHGCTAQFNSGFGIRAVADGNQISHCAAAQNTGTGIASASAGTVTSCSATSNGADGILAGSFAIVTSCNAGGNAGNGISVNDGCSVMDCVVNLNQQNGIYVRSDGTITRCTSRSNTLDGIQTGNSCRITENVCHLNANGIHLVSAQACRIENNHVISSSAKGIWVQGTRNLLIKNTVGFSSPNYEIAADNRYGIILDISFAGTPAVSGSTAATQIGGIEWANYSQ